MSNIWCTAKQASKYLSGDEDPLKSGDLWNGFPDMILNYMAFQ